MLVSRSELRTALAHLDDPIRLESHPLAQKLRIDPRNTGASRGQALRSVLRLAIASLDPGMGEPQSELQARAFQVLYRYAVARHSMTAIADSLGISLRQAYRELHHGIAALREVVSAELEPEADGTSQDATNPQDQVMPPSVQSELERLDAPRGEVVILEEVLHSALLSVEPLAARHGVQLSARIEPRNTRCVTNRALLRQVMVNLLSHVIGTRGVSSVSATLVIEEDQAVLSVAGGPRHEDESMEPGSPYLVAGQLADLLGLSLTRQSRDTGQLVVTLSIPFHRQHTVLLIDDNEGLVSLFRRYLRHQPYRVEAAASFREAMEALPSIRPDAVVLDVMLPDGDGWELLQAIRQSRDRAQPRVIVCSVIHDPLLAEALGADAYLRKPVSRVALLSALERALSLDRSAAARTAAPPQSG